MKIGRIIIFYIIFLPIFLHSYYMDVNFIHDFMMDKNAMITASVCWDKDKINHFVNNTKLRVSVIKQPTIDFKMFFNNRKNYNYVVMDLINCSSSWIFLEKVCEEKLFRYPVKFVFLVNNEISKTVISKTENKIGPNSEVFVANFENDGKINIIQYYRIKNFTDTIFENFGYWTNESGLVENYRQIPAVKRRSNFHKTVLNIGLAIINSNDSINHLLDFRFPTLDPFPKNDFPSMFLMAQHLNATMNIVIFDKFGYYNGKNKTWDGVVRGLTDLKVDIGDMYINTGRLTQVDYLRSVGVRFDTRFLFKKPSTAYMQNIYLLTFSSHVWYAVLLLICIFVPAFLYVLNIDGKRQTMENKQKKYSLSDICLISLEALCQQGTTTDLTSYASRTITLIFFTAFMFLYVAYSAYIIVLMQSTNKISLKELSESRIEVGGLNNNYMTHYFESVKEGVLRDIYINKIYPNQYFPLNVGMKKVQDGNFAFYVTLAPAYHYVNEKYTNYDICGLQTLIGYIISDNHIITQKNIQFKKILHVSLSRVIELGLHDRYSKRVFNEPKCFLSSGNFQPVRFYDCHFLFLVFIYGTILSIFLFLSELMVFKYNQRKNKTRVVY